MTHVISEDPMRDLYTIAMHFTEHGMMRIFISDGSL